MAQMTIPIQRILCMLAVASAGGMGIAGTAAAQGVDCAKAQSPVDRMICSDPALRALDGRIARSYSRLLRQLDRPSAEALRRDQRWFVSARDNAAMVRKGRVERADIADGLQGRATFLDAIVTRPSARFAGTWQNVAGSVTLTQKDGNRVAFGGGAADPQSARWVCEADGAGTIRSGSATIAIEVDHDLPWTIIATREGATLNLDEQPPRANSGSPPYCGFNGRLAGTYFRVAHARAARQSH